MPEQLEYDDFLAKLPSDRRNEVQKVWQLVRENMPEGFRESIEAKFLTFKAGGEWYAALSNQKNYISLYLMPIYVFPELKTKLDRSGKKLRCGKSCVNFKRADELPLDVIGEIIAATGPEAYLAEIEKVKGSGKDGK